MSFSFHIFVNFPNFFLLLISNFVLCDQKIYIVISVLFSVLRLVLWPSIWSLLENISSAPERKMYILLLGGMFCRSVMLISLSNYC